MYKKRITSLLLAVLMIVTLILPISAFAEDDAPEAYTEPVYEELVAEEPAAEEPAAEEPAAEEPAEEFAAEEAAELAADVPAAEEIAAAEEPAAEEPVAEESEEELASEEAAESAEDVPAAEEIAAVEETAAEEPAAEEPVAEEEAAPFDEGYALVKKGTVVYEEAWSQSEVGAFTEDSVVYALMYLRAENENDSWVRIVFDAGDEELQSGYLQFGRLAVLADEAVAELLSTLVNARDYEGKRLPAVSFEKRETVEAAEPEAVPTEEEIDVVVVSDEPASGNAAPSVTVSPAVAVAAVNANVEFTATVSNASGTPTYQWQFANRNSNSWSSTSVNGNKTATISFQATDARLAYKYRCKVTVDGQTLYSDAVWFVRPVTVSVSPAVAVAAVNANVEFTATVSNASGTPTYQWQFASRNSDSWSSTTVTGYKTATISFQATDARLAYKYRCKVTVDGQTLYSDAVWFERPAEATVTASPEVATATASEYVEFTATVSNVSGTPTYQWQYAAKNSESWSSTGVSGNKTDTIRFQATNGRLGYKYRCAVTVDGQTIYSNAVWFERPAEVTVTASPEVATATASEYVEFTATVSNVSGTPTYQWQYAAKNSESWSSTGVSGNKTDTIRFQATNGRLGYKYRCAVTVDGQTIYSNAVWFERPAVPTVTVSPAVAYAAVNANVEFTATVSNASGTPTYQWQFANRDSSSWSSTSVSGNKTATIHFQATDARLAYKYRCKVTVDGQTLYSDAVWFERPAVPTVTVSPAVAVAAVDANVEFTATVSNASGTPTYQWQFANRDSSSWSSTSVSGNKTATIHFQATDARLAYKYRCKVTVDGQTLYSDAVWFERPAVPTVTVSPAVAVAAVDANVEFTATVSNASGTPTYQWQFANRNSSSWSSTSVSGNKTATISFQATDARLAYKYRCKVTVDGQTLYSDAVWFVRPVTVTASPEIAEAAVDANVEFTATVENAIGTPTYQWQFANRSSSSWSSTSVSGNKTATISFQATDARLAYKYRCKVTVDGQTHYSNAVWFERPAAVDTFTVSELTYRVLEGTTVEVASYSGSAASLTVPATVAYQGVTYDVKAIGEEAFMGNTTLTSISLPNGIEIIKARAFKNCSNLSQMNGY